MKKLVIPLLTGLILVTNFLSINAQPTPPSGQQWQMVFNEDWNTWNENEWGRGSTPWGTENQSSCTLIPTEDTWVSGGNLVLRSRAGNFTAPSGETFPYTSGWAWMKNWRTYGYIEIRASFPNHYAAWPAFWMLGDGWPPEFDIAEWRGAPKNYMTRAFYNGTWYSQTWGGDYTGWNTYGLEWLPNRLRWYVNGNLRYEWNGTTPSEPMYVILSNGVDCADANGQGLPSNFLIDYVRWYQLSGSGGGTTYYQLRNRGTGLVIDGMGRTTNGEDAGQYANTTTHINSHWEMISTGSYYYFQNRGTGLRLDGMGRTSNGSDAGQWANTTSNNAQWSVQQYSGNYYRIQNRASGLYLDGMGRTANGAACGQYANTTSNNAQWELVPVSSGSRMGAESDLSARSQGVNEEEISIFPNPVTDFLNLTLPKEYDSKSTEIEIYDVAGQIVKIKSSVESGSQKLDLRGLGQGVYYVKITDGINVISRKFVKK